MDYGLVVSCQHQASRQLVSLIYSFESKGSNTIEHSRGSNWVKDECDE